jgi:predicted nuclease of predicted toxin-antitoxin system
MKGKLPPAKLLEAYTFYVERSLGGKVVPDALVNAGLKIERHKKYFEQDAEDVEWLPFCGAKGWIVLTKDKAIRSNEVELIALIRSGVATFVITSGEMTGEDMVNAYIKALPQIARFLKNKQRPFIARVSPEGEVTMWIDSSGKDHIQAANERNRLRKERRKKHKES